MTISTVWALYQIQCGMSLFCHQIVHFSTYPHLIKFTAGYIQNQKRLFSFHVLTDSIRSRSCRLRKETWENPAAPSRHFHSALVLSRPRPWKSPSISTSTFNAAPVLAAEFLEGSITCSRMSTLPFSGSALWQFFRIVMQSASPQSCNTVCDNPVHMNQARLDSNLGYDVCQEAEVQLTWIRMSGHKSRHVVCQIRSKSLG